MPCHCSTSRTAAVQRPWRGRGINTVRHRHCIQCASSEDASSGEAQQSEVVRDDSSTVGFKGGLRAVQSGVMGVTPEERVRRQQARKMEDAWLNGKGSLGMVLMANRAAAAASDKVDAAPGDLLPTILRWPSPYTFNVVVKSQPGVPNSALVYDICSIIGGVCDEQVGQKQCRVTERMSGKYLSLAVTLVVKSPELVKQVYSALAEDERVKMRF